MRTTMAWLFLVALLLGSCLPGRVIYTSPEIRGRVVDAETKLPLAGAAVIAVWYRETIVVGAAEPARQYYEGTEVVTNAAGEFIVPQQVHVTAHGAIDGPSLSIYLPGYRGFIGFKGFETVELSRAKTREERIESQGRARDLFLPAEKQPHTMELINRERHGLGLPPIGETR